MSAQDRTDGLNCEKNQAVHDIIRSLTGCNEVIAEGRGKIKSDITTDTGVGVSLKYARGRSTQVYITTLKALSEKIEMSEDVHYNLERFFGTTDKDKRSQWKEDFNLGPVEIKRGRVHSNNLPSFDCVVDWLNDNLKLICDYTIRAIDKKDIPVDFLMWADKKTGDVKVVDAELLVSSIVDRYRWSYNNTVLHCKDTVTGEKIFHLQMKGSGKGNGKHAPQFHIHNRWPKDTIVLETTDKQLKL
jgi:hypothetical protein